MVASAARGDSAQAHDLAVRPVTSADAALLLAWRNDPITRNASRSTDEVDPDGHVQWLENRLADRECVFLIGRIDGQPVGSVRFQGRPVAEVSISVAPGMRGGGIGRRLLLAGEDYAARVGSVTSVRAFTRTSNSGSQAMFRACGYQAESSDEAGTWFRKDLSRGG